MIETTRQGLRDDAIEVSVSKLCKWLGIPRRTAYYKPIKAAPKVDARFAEPIKTMIEESPSFGYRTVAHLLGFNKNTVQRIFQLKGVAGPQAGCRPAPANSGSAIGSPGAKRTLVNGPVPRLGWEGWLGDVSFGHRLPYA